MSQISDAFKSTDILTLRLIYDFLKKSRSQSYGKMRVEFGQNILEVEWMGYSPSTPNRNTHCRIKLGRIQDLVIPAAKMPAVVQLLRDHMAEKAKAPDQSSISNQI